MTDESIENYESPDLTVIQVRAYEVVVDAGDASASMDTAVRFQDGTIGRVVEVSGTRRLVVQVFPTSQIHEGEPVEVLDATAGLQEPSEGVHSIAEMNYVLDGIALDPPGPGLQAIDATRPPIATGREARDKIAPLAAGGVNLILNEGEETVLDELLSHLDASLVIRVAGEADITLEFEDDWQQLMALRVGAAWADSARRDGKSVAFAARLPTPKLDAGMASVHQPTESIADLVNELGRILVSTETGKITTLLEVDVSQSGVAEIAETMGFGEVDAQWFLDSEGRFDPGRSTSRADLGPNEQRERQVILRRLDVARKASERAEIFGEVELSDDEREALRFAERLSD